MRSDVKQISTFQKSFQLGVGWEELFVVENMSKYVTNVCPCYWPKPKMVTNNFGNKSLMQPMRVWGGGGAWVVF
jgi:hypothetical protein